jgi:hypothetical protein
VSKQSFKAMDLLIFSLLSAGSEALIIFGFNNIGKYDGYIVSFTVVLSLISIYRWNVLGIIPGIVGGVVSICMSLSKNISLGYILANTLSYFFLLFVLFWFKKNDKKEMRGDLLKMIGYYLSGYLLFEIGKCICFVIGTPNTANLGKVLITYVVWDLLNILVGGAVFYIACKQKVIVYDMNQYLIEQHSGTPTSRIRDDVSNYSKLEEMAEADDVSDIALLDGGTLSEDDLKLMNETYRKQTGTSNKYVEEQQAQQTYQKQKDLKKSNKENGGQQDDSSK